MNKKYFWSLLTFVMVTMLSVGFVSCGDDDDDGGNSGGDNTTTTLNIVGTWRAYYQSNGIQVYDLVTFNADHTGYVIEEVGNGTDYKNPITWTQTGNVIQVKLDGNYVITWTIMQIIDNNTVIISDGKRNYNVVRDGTGGGGGDSIVNDTINNPMSVADIYDIVVAMPSDEVSVYPYCAKGKVCSIKYPFSAEYGTSFFNISDTGYTGSKEFTVYQTYYKALGQKWVDGNPQIAVGDEVVVYGKVVNYRGTTPEFADKQSYIVTINGR